MTGLLRPGPEAALSPSETITLIVLAQWERSTRRAKWSKALRRQMASLRQIIETVFARLHGDFALERARPHTLAGFGVALASKAALHNFCIWLNRHLGRPHLAFADLVAW